MEVEDTENLFVAIACKLDKMPRHIRKCIAQYFVESKRGWPKPPALHVRHVAP